jgi:ATP-binding cassette subfamily B multidrug efflux pump
VVVFTALIGAFEALLFALVGELVDWIALVEPRHFFAERGTTLLALGATLMASVLLVAVQALFKYQTLFGNLPMRLRWNFHRLMLSQSMSFYQDEFSGRIATKVMQTSLAVRDVWMVMADIFAFIIVYFVTLTAVMGSFDLWMLAPFLVWLVFYVASLYYFIPRLGRVAKQQALDDLLELNKVSRATGSEQSAALNTRKLMATAL